MPEPTAVTGRAPCTDSNQAGPPIEGEDRSLEAFGGPRGLLAVIESVAQGDALPPVVDLLVDAWDDLHGGDLDAATEAILSAAARDDPLQTPAILDRLLFEPAVLKDLGRPLAARITLLARSAAGPLVAGAAVEAVVRLAIGGYAKQAVARGILVEAAESVDGAGTTHDHHEDYLRSICRSAGAALQVWPDPGNELTDLLRSLADRHVEVIDDAAFELAMTFLGGTLAAADTDKAHALLLEARTWLLVCQRYNEARPDADAFLAAINATLDFAQGGSVSRELADEVRTLAADYLVGTAGDRLEWRSARADVAVKWWDLVDAFARAADLGGTHWYQPADVIAAVGEVYSASRSLRCATQSTVLESEVALLMPTLTAPFLKDGQRRAWLERWLSEAAESDPGIRSGVEAVLSALDKPPEPPGKQRVRLAAESALRDALHLNDALGADVTRALSEAGLLPDVAAALRSREEFVSSGHGLVYDDIYRKLSAEFLQCPDYKGSVRAAGDKLLAGILAFVKDRLDTTTGPVGSPQYLGKLAAGDKEPLEEVLAQDLRSWLRAIVGGALHSEVRNIGAGRVDLVYIWPTFQLSIECKRRLRGQRVAHMDGNLAQAEQYQVTDVPVGFLVVADFTDKKRLADLGDCARVEVLSSANTTGRDHYVGVFVVQGNKPSPSSHRS